MSNDGKKIWTCKIGGVSEESLPDGADWPMRRAVRDAYVELTGREPDYAFTGWGGELTPIEREVLGSTKPAATDYACPECHADRVLADRGDKVGICAECGWFGPLQEIDDADEITAEAPSPVRLSDDGGRNGIGN